MLMHTESVGYSTEHRHVEDETLTLCYLCKGRAGELGVQYRGGLPLFKNPLEPNLILWRKTQPESERVAAGGVASTPSLCSGFTTGRVYELSEK